MIEIIFLVEWILFGSKNQVQIIFNISCNFLFLKNVFVDLENKLLFSNDFLVIIQKKKILFSN